MAHTTVRAAVQSDNTGIVTEIPVILTEAGPLYPLLEYMLEHAHARSFSWKQKVSQAVSLLLDYMAANHHCFEDPKDLFSTFVQRLYTGTFGDDGNDPSGLYWFPNPGYIVRQHTAGLSAFSDWMAKRMGTQPLNPWRTATRYEEMLNWAAWQQKHDRSFLAHTSNRGKVSETAARAKNVLLKRSQKIDHEGVKFFPDDRIVDLLFKGFIVPGKRRSPRIEERLNLRDILITLLLHFGGLRVSEAFHLYVHDVLPDPFHHDRAWVRIYHPGEGMAPDDWFDAKGRAIKCHREAYLRGKYGMRPRDQYFPTDQLHAGWKGGLLESKAGKFMNVYWFPSWGGELFLRLWNLYMVQRALKDCNHPFAFVTEKGQPYSVDSYIRAHNRAVERIGLVPGKMLGTTSHAHRHAFGQRLEDHELAPIVIKKAMHHKSIESQEVYTDKGRAKVTGILDAATQTLNEGRSLPPPDFLAYGFERVDPVGLFSGQNPKLRRG